MQKHVDLVDLVKSFPTNIFLQNSASIQKRTSPVKFAHFAEKSEKGSKSNFSTKVTTRVATIRAATTRVAMIRGATRRVRTGLMQEKDPSTKVSAFQISKQR